MRAPLTQAEEDFKIACRHTACIAGKLSRAAAFLRTSRTGDSSFIRKPFASNAQQEFRRASLKRLAAGRAAGHSADYYPARFMFV